MEQVLTPWQRFNDPERKKRYAALARVRPDNEAGRFEAACLTFPDQEDDNLALKAAAEYRFDRVVIEEMSRLATEEPEATLPTKAQQARDIYNLASGAASVDEKLKAHKLYAEIMGYVQKPGDHGGANVYVDNRRVMILPPAAPSLEDWENTAVQQQQRLVEHASR